MQVQSMRFGWSKKSPPDYTIRIRRSDFQRLDRLQVKQDFVERVAEKMVGEADDAPRFVVIPNITTFTQSKDKIQSFQRRLTQRVYRYLNTHHQSAVNPGNLSSNPFENAISGYGSQRVGNVSYHSNKELHFDAQAPFFAISYGPNKNIRGGSPLVADVRQYCRDNNYQLNDILEVKLDGQQLLLGLKQEHLDAVRKDYMLTLSDLNADSGRPIVLFNNRPHEGGIVHGATRPSKKDGTQEADRPLYLSAPINMEDLPNWMTKLGLMEDYTRLVAVLHANAKPSESPQ